MKSYIMITRLVDGPHRSKLCKEVQEIVTEVLSNSFEVRRTERNGNHLRKKSSGMMDTYMYRYIDRWIDGWMDRYIHTYIDR